MTWESFGREILDGWPDVGSLDGFDLQELGEKHGVLIPHAVNAPCGEYCLCAEFDNIPGTCYRITAQPTPE